MTPVEDTMVWIPGGVFTMGSDLFDIEAPIREVDVPGFWIDRLPVTHEQYYEYVQQTGVPMLPDWPEDGPAAEIANHPVERVTWWEARDYASWCGKRLPTEAEWEKAARGNDGREWPWGDVWIEENANVWDSAKPLGVMTIPNGARVGNSSPYGVIDLCGNVEEWVEDEFLPYEGSTAELPSTLGQCRVLRGGSWFYTSEMARCSFRRGALPTFSGYERAGGPGFRCVRS
ncbi:MAG TPA: formylglycine-generating enzyme family protein [Actinobacteria bacterium]|jgi:iron(II)-dependent oxidoreductase|nr:formylglycine-generating enzyme family protein [Actinomycetota bacterium]